MNIGVIGGGFFGMYLAEYLARQKHSVTLLEKEATWMSRASFVNQARVHNGYHYPRSLLTASRSHAAFARFVKEFAAAVRADFEKYYLIGKMLSKVTAAQYARFCRKIGVICETAPQRVTRLVNPHFIEKVFTTQEYAFDATVLRDLMLDRLQAAKVNCRLNAAATQITPSRRGLEVKVADDALTFDHVFNCTYSRLNQLNAASGFTLIPLKHEMTEMALVEPPLEIKSLGLTVMCGPFFSIMPFPPRGLHSFSHVRYTPHYEWRDGGADNNATYLDAHAEFARAKKRSAWEAIRRDAARYLPILNDCVYRDSLWEVKTVLPRSETDDSRPILFKPNYGANGFHCVMGGKIDNVYDAVTMIEQELSL